MGQNLSIKQLIKQFDLSLESMPTIQQAFYHSSYINESRTLQVSNERLEFLGDGILNLIIAELLYRKYDYLPEGELTKRRAQLVREEALIVYAAEINLSQYLFLGKGEEKSGGRQRHAIIADAFEAFIGAIFLTHGFDKARDVLLTIVQKVYEEDKLDISEVTDYKSAFQEYIQINPGKKIGYKVISESGPPHNRIYEVSVFVDEIIYGTGIGKTKKDAEQKAALAAMDKLVKQ
jgi:ribonuclease III, bacterial